MAPAIPSIARPAGPPSAPPRRRWLAAAAALGLLAAPWHVRAVQGQGQGRRRGRGAARRAAYPLAPGQSFWLPELSPAGPTVAVVNLQTQHVQLYRNGIAIGYSSASTGKPGHGTPTGLFSVLEKRRHHRSNLYNNAPMPWMVRLTWGGIAFHGGALPGYPASHGCIRLPMDFAPRLFSALGRGDTVAVVRPPAAGDAALTTLAPIDPQGQPLLHPEMLGQPVYWAEPAAPAHGGGPAPPALAPSAAEDAAAPPPPAPLALLASLPQRRLFVLRAGRVLATAALPPAASLQGLAAHGLFAWQAGGHWQTLGVQEEKQGAKEGAEEGPPDAARQATHSQGESGAADAAGKATDALLWRQVLPQAPAFTARLRQHLTPGSTLLVSELPAVGDVHLAAWRL